MFLHHPSILTWSTSSGSRCNSDHNTWLLGYDSRCASRVSYNTEYLAFLAAIFLPLSDVKGSIQDEVHIFLNATVYEF